MNGNIRQLNTFEIKAEISRFIKAVSNSKILINEDEFKLLDGQENKDEIVRLLLKEFMRCNDAAMPEIKLLLERYSPKKFLIEKMENIVTDEGNSNNLKLHAIELLSHIKKDWQQQDYQEYLEFDEEKMYEDTKNLLINSKNNPEIQLDFLDFLATIADADKYTLLEAMAEEQSGENLANVLVPLFLSSADSPIGIFALNLLKSTKSVYAYRSLLEVYDIMDENLRPILKKCLTELKFSGADRVKEKIHDYTTGRFSFVPPDADGSFCLFYEKKYEVNGAVKTDFFSVVCDDGKGIEECIGFTGIAEFEVDVFREKLLDRDKDIEISPEFFKFLLHKAEKLTYENSTPPYEYNCWKQLFIDIPQKEFDLNEILKSEYKVKKYTEYEIADMFEEEFTAYWFYYKELNDETQKYFSSVEEIFQSDDLKGIDLSDFVKKGVKLLITEDERKKWIDRLLLSAYYCTLKKSAKCAQILYSTANDENNQEVFYDYIIKYSIFHYFMELWIEKDFRDFSETKLAQIMKFFDREWGFYV